MTTDLQTLLEEVTGYPSTEQPFLSLYLNLQPDSNGRRDEMLQTLEQELERIANSVKARGGNLASVEADRERIMTYVNTEAPTDVPGLVIFACDAEGIWQAVPLHAPVETYIVEDRFAHTFNLARIIDDYETYAVVLADSQESRMFVIALNDVAPVGTTEADEKIKRFQAGGWGQMLFQRRTENLVKAHTKDIADHLSRLVKRYDVQHIIIAGNDSVKGHVLSSLPKPLEEKLVDYVHIDITANMPQILEAIEPLMRDVEQQQERDDIDTLEAQVNTKGGTGVVGIADTAQALSKGQVRHLIVLESFNALGAVNPNSGFLYSGMQSRDPYDGSALESVDLREAFTARAAQTGATIQIVAANEYLEQHEGVGALLWYNDEQSRTA
jgi:peptide chain release factor subunit 1